MEHCYGDHATDQGAVRARYRQTARDAIAGEFRGDNFFTLYYVWANLYGASEQAWDDARLVVQIGGDAENAMEVARGHGFLS